MQIWVPDVRAPEFVAKAHRQSVAIATSEGQADDQAYVDAISVPLDAEDEQARPTSTTCVTRGEIYTAAAQGAYTGKPRPVMIVQDDRFDATASVTVCPFTTNPVNAPLVRIEIEPSHDSGLARPSSLMVDKITMMPRSGLDERLGRLHEDELVQLNRSLMVYLGLASVSQS